MESRVLSGATTIYGIPRLSKPVAKLNTVTFSTSRPIRAVSDGGNLIWGRQLRPAILLETSPATKREILKPTLAAASSPAEGSDSAGWGSFILMDRGPDSFGLRDVSLISTLYLTRFLRRDAKVAPVGFLQKYPALVTGFFFFMW